ncbi:ABC transporter permease [Georgenia deserti]|uniref:ABC transporter permease n=1 Tax=Georgenia deserti TaxID=2093781 RepID=A0ABW4L2L7_9MICO
MTTTTSSPAPAPGGAADERESLAARLLRTLLTQRLALLAVLIAVVLAVMFSLDAAGRLSASYNFDYMSAVLINAVPLTMLALAELVVILTGRGAIDLSVGSIVSLAGMFFGFSYGVWGWPLPVALVATVLAGAVLGGFNGFLVAGLGFPPLIATLATYYGYWSIALTVNDQRPVNTEPIQGLYSLSRSVELPLIGPYVPLVPGGVFLFLLPTVVAVWLLVSRFLYGRKLYAVGTNDVASMWAGLDVRRTRAWAFIISGAISGLVAVVTVSQFASARPDAGTAGNGMALPAITIAVLGGVAITGGIGRVAGVVGAALLVVWLDAGILLLFAGNIASQVQLLALGLILIGAALLNGVTSRRYGTT